MHGQAIDRRADNQAYLEEEHPMTIRVLAIVSAVLAGLFGLAALLVPAPFLGAFRVELPEAGLLTTRLLGAQLVALSVVDWFARDDLRGGGRPGTERGIVLANLLGPALSIVLLVTGMLGGIVGALAWVNVALLAVVAVGWVYLGLMRGTDGRPA
jgi:hypothetical protein